LNLFDGIKYSSVSKITDNFKGEEFSAI